VAPDAPTAARPELLGWLQQVELLASRAECFSQQLLAAESELHAVREENGELMEALADADGKLTALASAADKAIRTDMSASSAAAAALAAAAVATAGGTNTPSHAAAVLTSAKPTTPLTAHRADKGPTSRGGAALYGSTGGDSGSGISSTECTPQRDQDGRAKSGKGQGMGGVMPAVMMTSTVNAAAEAEVAAGAGAGSGAADAERGADAAHEAA
ncbi:hypothetical protein Agub_g14948, partial [Astrephomene gubernaculifera]